MHRHEEGIACVAEEAVEPSLDAHIEYAHEAAWAHVPMLAKLAAAPLLKAGRSPGFLQAGQCVMGEWLMRGRV